MSLHWSDADLQRVLRGGQVRLVGKDPPPAECRIVGDVPADQVPLIAERHSPYRSKTEQRYAWRLQDFVHQGEITTWLYEPLKLRLGYRCWYTPDFLVVWRIAPWPPVLVEVKGGFVRDDARVKLMTAAHQYRMFRFQEARWRQGTWTMTEIPAAG